MLDGKVCACVDVRVNDETNDRSRINTSKRFHCHCITRSKLLLHSKEEFSVGGKRRGARAGQKQNGSDGAESKVSTVKHENTNESSLSPSNISYPHAFSSSLLLSPVL